MNLQTSTWIQSNRAALSYVDETTDKNDRAAMWNIDVWCCIILQEKAPSYWLLLFCNTLLLTKLLPA